MQAGGGLIERVREGMAVVDADGQRIGTVERVRFGDGGDGEGVRGRVRPDNVAPGGPGLPGSGGSGGGEPGFLPLGAVGDEAYDQGWSDVPGPVRQRLVSGGYLKVDGPGPGFLDTDRYVPADAIAEVTADAVVLRSRKGELPTA